jgi:lipopolysaccharide assembly outer membrane protein LptD (OstA)
MRRALCLVGLLSVLGSANIGAQTATTSPTQGGQVGAQTPVPGPGAPGAPGTTGVPATRIQPERDPNQLPNQDSNSAEFVGNHWIMRGDVELGYLGSPFRFFADYADLDLTTRKLIAKGNVVFADANGRISADEIEFDIANGTGTFHNASGSMQLGQALRQAEFPGQDPDVYFYGQVIEKLDARKYKLTRGAFTTCVQPTPRWEMTSSAVTIDLDDYALVRNMVLKVKGVPVLYLPAIYYPIQDGDRATGFLMPTYGASTVRGQAITNGFFWALGRSHDLTFVHDWYTRTGQGGGGEYNYIANDRSFGNVRLYGVTRKEATFRTGTRTTTLPAGNSFQMTGTATHAFGTQWRARGFVDYFSDLVTQQLYNQNVYQATQSRRTIEGSLSGTLGIASANAHFQRNEYLTGATSSQVYGSTPRISANVAPQMLFGTPIYASVNTEFARIPNEQYANGLITSDRTLNKWDLAPMIRAPLSRLTFLSANASASTKTTYYSRSRDAQGDLTDVALMRNFLNLRSEVIGPVLTKIWDTPDSVTIERMKHVIEPTFYTDYTTEIANQASVPLLNDASDFTVGGAARFTYGVTNRLFVKSRPSETGRGQAREFLTVGVFQTYYTNSQSSLFDTTYVSYSRRPKAVNLSPVSMTARFSPMLGFDTNARMEYDVNGNGMQIFSVGSTIGATRGSGSVNYSRQRPSALSDVTSYLSASSSVRMRQERVTAMYALSWDIARSYVQSQTMAWSYMAQCCGFQLEAQIFSFPPNLGYPVTADRRFNVSVVLAGLGRISSPFGAFGGLR